MFSRHKAHISRCKQEAHPAMDIPSVRRPPVSVMVPADRVSAHDLPLAESLSAVVKREKYHKRIAALDSDGQSLHDGGMTD